LHHGDRVRDRPDQLTHAPVRNGQLIGIPRVDQAFDVRRRSQTWTRPALLLTLFALATDRLFARPPDDML